MWVEETPVCSSIHILGPLFFLRSKACVTPGKRVLKLLRLQTAKPSRAGPCSSHMPKLLLLQPLPKLWWLSAPHLHKPGPESRSSSCMGVPPPATSPCRVQHRDCPGAPRKVPCCLEKASGISQVSFALQKELLGLRSHS